MSLGKLIWFCDVCPVLPLSGNSLAVLPDYDLSNLCVFTIIIVDVFKACFSGDHHVKLIRVTYNSVHSSARSWSIPSEVPYEEAVRQIVGAAPRFSRVWTPPLLPIPLPAPSTSRRADIPEADTPPRKRLLLTTPRPSCEVGEEFDLIAAARGTEDPTMALKSMAVIESSSFIQRHHDARGSCKMWRAEIEVLRRERLAYEQESIQTRQDLARSEAHCRALEARVTVLETEVRRHEWQRQAADDLAVQHIMRTQALEVEHAVDNWRTIGSCSRLWL
ncbi:hypothetical protein Tco_0667756 [Tanacetum coccineum]